MICKFRARARASSTLAARCNSPTTPREISTATETTGAAATRPVATGCPRRSSPGARGGSTTTSTTSRRRRTILTCDFDESAAPRSSWRSAGRRRSTTTRIPRWTWTPTVRRRRLPAPVRRPRLRPQPPGPYRGPRPPQHLYRRLTFPFQRRLHNLRRNHRRRPHLFQGTHLPPRFLRPPLLPRRSHQQRPSRGRRRAEANPAAWGTIY